MKIIIQNPDMTPLLNGKKLYRSYIVTKDGEGIQKPVTYGYSLEEISEITEFLWTRSLQYQDKKYIKTIPLPYKDLLVWYEFKNNTKK